MASSSSTTTLAGKIPTVESPYVITSSQCYVSRDTTIEGSRHVELRGRSVLEPHVTLRGDLAWIRIGRYCYLHGPATVIQPPPLPQPSSSSSSSPPQQQQQQQQKDAAVIYAQVTIGSHVVIGNHSRIEAAAIGSYCWIGNHVRIGPRCIIKDNCIIADHVVLPPDTVIPPFTRVSPVAMNQQWQQSNNNPSFVDSPTEKYPLDFLELPPSIPVEIQERTMELYHDFVARQPTKVRIR